MGSHAACDISKFNARSPFGLKTQGLSEIKLHVPNDDSNR